MSVALHGNLKDFGIAEVFQLIGQQRKTGLLELKGAGGYEVCLAFDEGAVVWASPVGRRDHEALGHRLVRCGLMTQEVLTSLLAESEASARSLPALIQAQSLMQPRELEEISELLTHETIFDVLRWTGGSFHFSTQRIQHDRPPEKLLGAEQILMDGLRMVDEWQTFCDRVPDDEAVMERRGSLDQYRQRNQRELRCLPEQADKIYQLVDGRMNLRRVIDLSRLGVFEATRAVAELMEAGLVAPIQAPMVRATGAVASGRSALETARMVAVTILPLIALAIMIGFIHHQAAVKAARTTAFPIVRPDLAQVQGDFERRRLRHAIEANRYLTGDWPATLEAPDETALLGRGRLAPESSAPYYYARSENGIVLLTPER